MPWVIHCRYCFASIRSKHLFAAPSSLEIQNWRLENQAHGISGGCARSSILRASRRHGSGGRGSLPQPTLRCPLRPRGLRRQATTLQRDAYCSWKTTENSPAPAISNEEVLAFRQRRFRRALERRSRHGACDLCGFSVLAVLNPAKPAVIQYKHSSEDGSPIDAGRSRWLTLDWKPKWKLRRLSALSPRSRTNPCRTGHRTALRAGPYP